MNRLPTVSPVSKRRARPSLGAVSLHDVLSLPAMTQDPERERQRLTELYAGMSDGELDAIASDSSSLTDVARQALELEKSHRQPGVAAVALESPSSASQVEWEDLVVVKQFRDLPEALLAKGSLESAGIECSLADDNMVRMDWFISNLVGGAKLCVRPEDAEAAMELLEQPFPENFDVEGVGNYEQPKCPECDSLDISYETLNKPVAYTSAWILAPIPLQRKRWKCNACGHEWKDESAEE